MLTCCKKKIIKTGTTLFRHDLNVDGRTKTAGIERIGQFGAHLLLKGRLCEFMQITGLIIIYRKHSSIVLNLNLKQTSYSVT
jgi:hypothetical protein